jgi:pantetheine-phosphate adenylyltransferase
MSDRIRSSAVFPGAFDPITNGHVDLIRRAAAVFDELVVGVGDNPEKSPFLPAGKRAEIIRQVVAGLTNVRVETYRGLTVDFAARIGAKVLVRGIRNVADLHFEAQVAYTNRQVTGVETLFLLPAPEWSFLSSGLIRQIARQGGDISKMVPAEVLPHLPKMR